MAAGKPDQGAARSGAERSQEQRSASGANEKAKPQDAGPQGGYGPGGPGGYGPGGYGPGGPGNWWGGPGGYGMPPFGPPGWGMPPGMTPPGPYGYGMPPGGPQGGAQHHPHGSYDPSCPPTTPWPWMSWFMPWFGPWLGPWWSWLSSWMVWPGTSWMFQGLPPFLPYPLTPGAAPASTMHYAEIRATFWRHWFETWAQIAQQAAADCYIPNPAQQPVVPRVDPEQLRDALREFPEDQKALVIHAVQVLQAWDAAHAKPRAGADW